MSTNHSDRLRILVWHADAAGRRLVDGVVRQLGHRPLAVATADEVLQALETGGVDALIVEHDIADDALFALIKLIRFSTLGEPHLPVILLTRTPRARIAAGLAAAAVDACLDKPVAAAELARAIAALARPRCQRPSGRW